MHHNITPVYAGQVPDRTADEETFVDETIVADTHGFTIAEVRDLALGDPPVVRSRWDGDHLLIGWGDAQLVRLITSPLGCITSGEVIE